MVFHKSWLKYIIYIYVTHRGVYLYGYDMIVSYARNHNSFMKFIMCGECNYNKV